MQRLLSLVTKVPIKSGARLLIASIVSAFLVIVTDDPTWPLWISALMVVAVILPVLYFFYHLPAQKQDGEFPSYEAALAWYHSDEYRPLKELRQANGRTTILLLDGWPEGDDFEQYLERRRVEWRADDAAEQQGGAARA